MAPTDDNVVSASTRINRVAAQPPDLTVSLPSCLCKDFVFDPSMTDEGEIARINTEEFFAQDSKIWRQSDQKVAEFEDETEGKQKKTT